MSKMLNGLVKIGGDSPEAGLCVDGFCALPPQTGEAPAQEAEDQAMRAKEEAATAPKGDGS
ncbi:hypothetical protein [Neomegalonema perideroedes]|uniref:hypothetical protein n=1 Tax=Neomegalonema perideroedes TaxID=217219 RepID=UPI00037C1960|nr:hypothetical protein [Neomegalonema perideroedes]